MPHHGMVPVLAILDPTEGAVEQTLINVALGAVSAVLGWVLKVVWDSLQALKRADEALASKVGAIEVLVAGSYVTRAEFREELAELHKKLDRVLETLNKKVDRK